MNRFFDLHLAQNGAAGASRLARLLPVYLVAWVLVWVSGVGPKRFFEIKEKVHATMAAGALPIGLGMAAAGIFIMFLFVLS